MERNIPQISPVGRFYFFLAGITMVLIFSSGEKWNTLFDITGILLPTGVVIAIGLVVSLIFGYLDKVDGKPSLWMIILYPLGFLVGFYIMYWCFNSLQFASISGIMVAILLVVALAPGFIFLKLFERTCNRRLENKYWEEYERNRASVAKEKNS